MQRNTSSRHIPERFLRQLWKHQHFNTQKLQTTEGMPVEVLSTGKLNSDGGPDFIDARIRIGNVLYRGAVELHQHYNEWNEHAHHNDTKYNGVILHVVLHGSPLTSPASTKSKRLIPVLALDRFLDATYRSTWATMILDERSERMATIKCCSVNDSIDQSLIKKWLEKLAIERVELKVQRYEERLKELIDQNRLSVKEPPSRYDEIPFGINPEDLPSPANNYSRHDFSRLEMWSQIVYEGIMEALGYSKNQAPFLKLGRTLPLNFFTRLKNQITDEELLLHYEALLFGVTGLLPLTKNLSDRQSIHHVRKLKKIWTSLRAIYYGEILHEADWQFFRLRPENFPTIRLAGAAHLISQILDKNFFKSIIQNMKNSELTHIEKFKTLERLIIIPAGGFWVNHYRFGEASTHEIKVLIGSSRADEIILNTLIPVCLLYARVFKDKDVRIETLNMFRHIPPPNPNAITTIIEKQLIKGKCKLDSAMIQQGAIQLYKRYCINERCAECAVGKLVF